METPSPAANARPQPRPATVMLARSFFFCFVWPSCKAMGYADKYPIASYLTGCPGSDVPVTQGTLK